MENEELIIYDEDELLYLGLEDSDSDEALVSDSDEALVSANISDEQSEGFSNHIQLDGFSFPGDEKDW